MGELLGLLGHAHTQAGEHEKAQAVWLQVAQIDAIPELHRLLAMSFETTGDTAASRRHLALAQYEEGTAAWLKNDLITWRKFAGCWTTDLGHWRRTGAAWRSIPTTGGRYAP
jgi:hypothetical protein